MIKSWHTSNVCHDNELARLERVTWHSWKEWMRQTSSSRRQWRDDNVTCRITYKFCFWQENELNEIKFYLQIHLFMMMTWDHSKVWYDNDVARLKRVILLRWKEWMRRISSNTLQHSATHCNTLQYTATHCNTLQHTATHCNTLQCTDANVTWLERGTWLRWKEWMRQTSSNRKQWHDNEVLHHYATHCNTLRYTAIHYNVLMLTWHD